mmetsp:Transcript_8063/g.24284  ORF Transcript_8063/g.24284 Transcript_8063/m.24284 type:complete len:148 (+) Transcript_8063:274-717(+)
MGQPLVEVLVAKLHRVVCTEANLDYMGSVTVDEDWLDATDLFEGQRVDIANLKNGARLSTYIIRGKRGSGMLCMNGAAAHLVNPGDQLIVMAYGLMTRSEYQNFLPKILLFESSPSFRIESGVVKFYRNPVFELKESEEHGPMRLIR